jgi:hypothetical protein
MSIQTVADLIAALERCDPSAPVSIASQPTWPFEYTIVKAEQADDGTVYIEEGSQVGYLSRAARDAIGW